MEYVLYAVGAWVGFWVIYGFIKSLIDAARMPHKELHEAVQTRKAHRGIRRKAASREATKKSRNKSGPLFGSHSVEAMLLGENNHIAGRWAARKARDKFFRF